MRNRIIAVTLAAVLCGTLTASCRSGSPGDTTPNTSPVCLTIWHNDNQNNDPDSRHQRILQIAKQYTELHPHVTFESSVKSERKKCLPRCWPAAGLT